MQCESSETNIKKAWTIAKDFLYPQDLSEYSSHRPKSSLTLSLVFWRVLMRDIEIRDVKDAFDVLAQCKMLPVLMEDFLGEFKEY